jgi:short subunit dehydrogenase-like uncharacterized protein
MSGRTEWMIYGANGYTGHLVAAEATRRGLNPVLAGRRAGPIEKLAAELGLTMRVFDLHDAPAAMFDRLDVVGQRVIAAISSYVRFLIRHVFAPAPCPKALSRS